MKYSLDEDQVSSLLNEISNPALRNLFKMILQSPQTQPEEKNDSLTAGRNTLNKTVEDVKHLLEINKATKIVLTELKIENEKMIERYRTLTSALGACECLGEDVICPICNGKGTPGSLLVNENAFNKYVYPLIQRITQTADQAHTPNVQKNYPKEKQNGASPTSKN
jgi:hypothetical protein